MSILNIQAFVIFEGNKKFKKTIKLIIPNDL